MVCLPIVLLQHTGLPYCTQASLPRLSTAVPCVCEAHVAAIHPHLQRCAQPEHSLHTTARAMYAAQYWGAAWELAQAPQGPLNLRVTDDKGNQVSVGSQRH